MSQETNQFDQNVDHEVNIDSSSKAETTQEEKKYAFNQAEVNQDEKAQGASAENGEPPRQEYNHDGGYVNNLHNEDMGPNQNQNAYYNQYKSEMPGGKPTGMFGFFGEQQKLPNIKTDDDARNAYFGINQPYYNKAYKEYKEGKKISWNWCAFLFQSQWFFSRKMYVIGTLYSLMMSFILVSMTQIRDNLSNPSIQAMALPWVVVFLVLWIATGMFANYVYLSHMENKIIYPSDNKYDSKKLTQIIMVRGGFSVYGVLLSLLLSEVLVQAVESITTLLR